MQAQTEQGKNRDSGEEGTLHGFYPTKRRTGEDVITLSSPARMKPIDYSVVGRFCETPPFAAKTASGTDALQSGARPITAGEAFLY